MVESSRIYPVRWRIGRCLVLTFTSGSSTGIGSSGALGSASMVTTEGAPAKARSTKVRDMQGGIFMMRKVIKSLPMIQSDGRAFVNSCIKLTIINLMWLLGC